jgi:hypothetical protein
VQVIGLHFLPERAYTFLMEPDIVCKPSAFKHGAGMADIYSAFSTAVYDVMLRDDREKRLLIGEMVREKIAVAP